MVLLGFFFPVQTSLLDLSALTDNKPTAGTVLLTLAPNCRRDSALNHQSTSKNTGMTFYKNPATIDSCF